MHTLRLKIPFSENVASAKSIKPLTTTRGISPQYTEEQVYQRIDKYCSQLKSTRTSSEGANTPPIDRNVRLFGNDIPSTAKIDALADYLSNEPNSKYLPLHFVENKHILKPYDELRKLNKTNEKARLSVTKIIPYAFCELKKMYQLYIGDASIETKAMVLGKQIHRNLEVASHPQIQVCLQSQLGNNLVTMDREVLLSAGSEIPNDTPKQQKPQLTPLIQTGQDLKAQLDTLTTKESSNLGDKTIVEQPRKTPGIIDAQDTGQKSQLVQSTTDEDVPMIRLKTDKMLVNSNTYKLMQTTTRLLKLLEFGECREVLVHALYNREKDIIVSEIPRGDATISADENIVISGIIDELRISSDHENAFETFQKELHQGIKNSNDYDHIFKVIRETCSSWTDDIDPMLYLLVGDVKTRMQKRKPSLQVQYTQLLQVGMYRKLLGLLTKDVNFTYQSWRANMKGRNENVDDPLPNDLVAFCCLSSKLMFNDFKKMKNGIDIEFEGILQKPKDTAINTVRYEFKNQSNDKSIAVLNGVWKNPPTLSYIIARLSQVQMLLRPFLNDRLQITYIEQRSNTIFGRAESVYDAEYIQRQIHTGLELWMGTREPSPTNLNINCKNCEFNLKCIIPRKRQGLE